jgi:hypothetical protein
MGLIHYKFLIHNAIHKVTRFGTNRIERKNLSLRTQLKRLNRCQFVSPQVCLYSAQCKGFIFGCDGNYLKLNIIYKMNSNVSWLDAEEKSSNDFIYVKDKRFS